MDLIECGRTGAQNSKNSKSTRHTYLASGERLSYTLNVQLVEQYVKLCLIVLKLC